MRFGDTRLDDLLERWANGYDWAVHERRVDALPWQTVRVVHQRSADPAAPVVVLPACRSTGSPGSSRVTGTIGTSFATYVEPVTLPDRVDTPTVLSVFPRDTKPEPRSYAEVFLTVRDYVEHRAGGHFAAWEQPEAYVADVRRAIELGG
jgi:hypothetical protein